jgi:threonine aldolase
VLSDRLRLVTHVDVDDAAVDLVLAAWTELAR